MKDEPSVMVHKGYNGKFLKEHPDCPPSVPMSLLSEEWARKNHEQSLARLNERGGLSPCEMIANIERRSWHSMPTDVAIKQIRRALETHLKQIDHE